MSITPLPPAPDITDTTSEFNTKAFNWVAALDTFTTEANATAVVCTDAEVTASAALAVVGAVAWVSGTTYAIGDPVYSPIDLQTYRRKTVGAGTTDPSADATNWEKVAINAPTATQAEMEAGTSTTVKSVTPERIKQAIIALAPAPPSGGFNTMSVVTSSSTFTIPSGKTIIKVTVVGAGGGGGAGNGSSAAVAAGGGGSGISYLTSLTPGNTISVTIGAGGSGGTSGGSGTAGGSTIIASGTQTITTITATGGGFGSGANFGGPAGLGGSCSGATLNISGTGAELGTENQGRGSTGGSSILGGGGRASTTGAGGAGGNYGGGGGGGATNGAGGAGAAGVVIFEY